MRILMVYPRFADALWAYKHALAFVGKRASSPPLGLLTVAAMLPEAWDKKLVDLNVAELSDDDLRWADCVFLSAMLAQQASAEAVIARCQRLGIKIVAGGPLYTHSEQAGGLGVDHVVVGEAEGCLPALVRDLEHGRAAPIYKATDWPDLQHTPPPLWRLANQSAYSLMAVQFTRGCPYDCEFCDVVALNGFRPRLKGGAQVLAELDALYCSGWRGHVFVCDDNLLGNSRRARVALLPAIGEWMGAHNFPFVLTAAVSVDLAEDDEVMRLMVEAGFDRVTVGIESPDDGSLAECGKFQNRGRDLLAAVRRMQSHGLEVQGGFIVGFDNDPAAIFERQIQFVQASGIATAMVSVLFAFPGTRLHHRLRQEHRLLPLRLADTAYGLLNYVPRMGGDALVAGHKQILTAIYAPQPYYERVKRFLEAYQPPRAGRRRLEPEHIRTFFRALWLLGVVDGARGYFWRLLSYALLRRARSFPVAARLAVTGYFFRKDVEDYIG